MPPAVAVRERPILFSGKMVRAILDGRKTQTRRVITRRMRDEAPDEGRETVICQPGHGYDEAKIRANYRCPHGQPGDRLWVRETWAMPPGYDACHHGDLKVKPPIGPVCYGADYGNATRQAWTGSRWRPSIHMPRWASRLTLEITEVRVQRVRDISEEDARAEGCPYPAEWAGRYVDRDETARTWYSVLWDTLNTRRNFSWESNPYVWAISFSRVS